MPNFLRGAAVGVAGLAMLGLAARTWGQFREYDESVVVLSARRLAALPKAPLKLPAGGEWHAFAWQRGGAEVTWTIAGKPLPPAKADGAAEAYRWVSLGVVMLPGDQPVPIVWALPGLKDANAPKAPDAPAAPDDPARSAATNDPRAAKNAKSAKDAKDAKSAKSAGARQEPKGAEGADDTLAPGPAGDAVAALVLSRRADCDPARLWRLMRVYPEAPLSAPDERLDQCRHLNMRFTMPQQPTRAAWEARADWLREHIRASCGLLPEPDRTELKAQVFGRLERDGYTIEKAYIESRPGFYVTGNLYRPLGKEGPFPAVACPHGHGKTGRLGEAIVGRSITLARLGYVVFAWDMVGYNDSARQTGKHAGVFASPANEAWGLSLMHLQTWNTIRAIDFLLSLPEVDKARIGVTGCSGGGTQTFMVMGIDPRVTAAAPVCMVSGIMQGGCECENAPLLRIETCNIEIASLMAPRPLILPSVTGDWTKETPQHEYPAIRGVYQLYDAADRVANVHAEGPHGYPKCHRESVYGFFEKHICARGDGGAILEPNWPQEKPEDMLVWQGRDLPEGAKTPDALAQYIVAECQRRRDELLPKAPGDRGRFEQTLGAAWRHAMLVESPKAEDLAAEEMGSESLGEVRVARLLLGRKGAGDRVPAIWYRAKGPGGKRPVAVVVHPEGKAGLIDPAAGGPGRLLAALLRDGHDVLAIDAYLTGEFLSPLHAVRQKVEGKYFTTYNRTALVHRVQDILTAVAYAQSRPDSQRIGLVGVGQAGAWCLLAAPFVPPDVPVAADLAGLTGDDDPRWQDDLFTPCILKAGGAWTAAALAAPRRLLVHNLAGDFDAAPFRAAYAAAGAADRLTVQPAPCAVDAILRWLK